MSSLKYRLNKSTIGEFVIEYQITCDFHDEQRNYNKQRKAPWKRHKPAELRNCTVTSNSKMAIAPVFIDKTLWMKTLRFFQMKKN